MTKKHAAQETIVLCGNTPIDANPLGAAPLAQALSLTNKVIYVEPPISYATLIKKPQLRHSLSRPRFRQHSQNLWVLTPLVAPGKDRTNIHHITSALLRRSIRKYLNKILDFEKGRVTVIATSPVYDPFVSTEHTNIAWVMDDYVSQPELIGINPRIVSQQFSRLVNKADHIVCASHVLAQSFEGAKRCTVVENGADENIFTFPSSQTFTHSHDLPSEDFCLYVGGINARVDIDTFESVAETGIPFVIAGPTAPHFHPERIQKLFERTNVTYLSIVPNAEIGALMNRAAVGLVPYAQGDFNEASMPLKIPEYLMSGLPVVSSNLSFARTLDHVFPALDADQFAQIVFQKVSMSLTNDQRHALSEQSSQKWSWSVKARDFLRIVES